MARVDREEHEKYGIPLKPKNRRRKRGGGRGNTQGNDDSIDSDSSSRQVGDYFEPAIDEDDSRESHEGEVRGSMLRQPLNSPHWIRSGRVKYDERVFDMRDELLLKPGRRDMDDPGARGA